MAAEEEALASRGKNLEDESSSGGHGTVSFYKLFSFSDVWDKLLIVVGTIAAIGHGLNPALMALLFGELADAFGGNQSGKILPVVSKVSLKLVYVALGCGAAAFLQVACWMITGERQAARIRTLYLKTILQQDIAFFDKEVHTGEVIGRMSGDTVLIQEAMGEKVGKFIQLMSTFFGGFVIAFSKQWLLTLVMLSSIPPLMISGGVMSHMVAKMASRAQNAYASAAVVVEQTIGAIRMVASYTGEKQAVSDYSNSLQKAYKSGVYEGLATGLGLGSVMFMMFCSYALAVWYGGKIILEKGYNGGDIFTAIVSVLMGSMSLGQASPCIAAFAAGRAAAFKMFEIIDRKPEIDPFDDTGMIFGDIRGNIELKDVYFSYPARPTEEIFSGFSLFIPYGTTAALVGQSGSGKSTVISLIERFYDPSDGEVLIDGTNIKEFQLKWLRSKIGLVSQEPVLFMGSIKDNIAYGKDGATDEEIRAAAELANAAKFIDKLPQGLDSTVGEHGAQLSGGQKQRIAIARAILKDPRILLLDEATSALDAESERIVQEALDRIMINRTTVIVAHRLTTVRNANIIAVIHKGKMIEKGTHSELLEDPEGAYSQLIRLQEAHKDTEVVDEQDKASLSMEYYGRQTSQRASLLHLMSQRSSRLRSISSRHSMSITFDLSRGLSVSRTEIDNLELASYDEMNKHPKVPISRLAALNKPELPMLIVGCLSAILNGAIVPYFGILLSYVIKTYYEPPHKLREDSRFWALMFVVLGAVSLVAYPLRTFFFGMAGCRLIRRIRLMCFEKVVNMEVAWFDEPANSSGVIGARLSADAATIRALVGDALAQLVQDLSSAAVGLVIAFLANWQLALIVVGIVPLIGLNGYVQLKFMMGFSADAKLMYEEASQVANDALGTIRTVASYCAEEKVIEIYRQKCEDPVKMGVRQGLISGIGFGLSLGLVFASYALAFYAGARLVDAGKTTFSDVFRVFFALNMAAVAVSQSSTFAPDSSKAKSATASIFAILDRKSNIDPSDGSGMILENLKGEIELEHISFKYPTRPDFRIFRDLSLKIQSGKTVALVGVSGSGKSTVISLLQRFYEPHSGVITIDGVDIQKFQLKWLRQQMGLVSQEPILFNETIRDNIAYGKGGNATEAEVIAAAELANAHKFISGLQQGYDTMVGERGAQLSGGQKQRIAIARAMIKNPKIVLLDEATSALDAESERVVQDALDRVMVNRTTVVVAHRLSTIKGADIIAVVKNGVIVEKGKHDNLIKITDGFYASLVALHTSASS
ncbi:ABC transporter B family member 21-like isoform X1 [Primulina eburnea]|uniref:ABC transporter B family member 21-like isoform X1 n=1 Tax=Primulina eburnea TaxID=1245227 RepID=UPI003C6C07A6